jgi:hypothetical protein
VWANPYTADAEDYRTGFESQTSELLPAFIRYHCVRDHVSAIDPQRESFAFVSRKSSVTTGTRL